MPVRAASGARDLLDGNLHHVVSIKGQMSGKHLVHHDAHRVDVAGAVGLVSFCLLRADIMHAAHCLAGQHLVICPGNAGDTEVHHAQLAVIQQHNILGLDIPVDDAPAVGMAQACSSALRIWEMKCTVSRLESLPPRSLRYSRRVMPSTYSITIYCRWSLTETSYTLTILG